MPPHGGGLKGAAHSHDPEFPDDDWNLYSMLDPSGFVALNVTQPEESPGIFRPFARRLAPTPFLISDSDAEMIIIVRFTSPVNIRKLMVIGGGEVGQHPSQMKCYCNQDAVDFGSIGSMRPAQEFPLAANEVMEVII